MPGSPETLMDLSVGDGRVRFAVYAQERVSEWVAALKESGAWWRGESERWQQNSARAWNATEVQIRFVVGEEQMAAACDIWEDVFECAWTEEGERTPVIFRCWLTPGGGHSAGIIALFPTIPADYVGHCQSYEHVGQHGAADYNLVIRRTSPIPSPYYILANVQANALKQELESLGYCLHVVQRRTPTMRVEFEEALDDLRREDQRNPTKYLKEL